jgi:hypothetical protein
LRGCVFQFEQVYVYAAAAEGLHTTAVFAACLYTAAKDLDQHNAGGDKQQQPVTTDGEQ